MAARKFYGRPKPGTKYHNRKTTVNGITFDSKKEAVRYNELLLRQELGLISNLERQVKFVLIPTQREPDKTGSRGGKTAGKVIERECSYIADFVYFDIDSGCQVVEDTKGIRTPEYVIKRKLMLFLKGIRIREI